MAAPAVEVPLSVRPAVLKHHGHDPDEESLGPLVTRFGCLVVESPLCNAFSLGFGPARASDDRRYQEAPGVIVVQTGKFLNLNFSY